MVSEKEKWKNGHDLSAWNYTNLPESSETEVAQNATGTHVLFSGNCTFPIQQIQGTVRIFGGTSDKPLKQNRVYELQCSMKLWGT